MSLSALEEFFELLTDKYVDDYQMTPEQMVNFRENIRRELRMNAIFGDLQDFVPVLGMHSLSNSIIARLITHSLRTMNAMTEAQSLDDIVELHEKLRAAKKSLLKAGPSWAGYKLLPRNFQLLYLEFDDEGNPTGMFTRRLHYGNFFKYRKQTSLKAVADIEAIIQNELADNNFHFVPVVE